LNRFVDDPVCDTHRYGGAEFLANIGKVLPPQIATRRGCRRRSLLQTLGLAP
jgi:hypothetical protein